MRGDLSPGALLRRVAFTIVAGTFALAIFAMKWPWFVELAVVLAIVLPAMRLYDWRFNDAPEQSRWDQLRGTALLIPAVGAGVLLWFWLRG